MALSKTQAIAAGQMPDAKPVWTSTTFWGTLFTVAGMVLPMFNIGTAPDYQHLGDSFANMLVAALDFGGLLLAFIGRIRATQQVSLRKSVAWVAPST